MSNELEGIGQSGVTTYAMVKRRGLFYDGSTFVAYATADRADYAVTMSELGVASGEYQGDFPPAITESGSYSYVVYQTTINPGTPTEGDTYIGGGTVDWTGTASASATSGSMTGSDFYDYLVRTFGRTDKPTEVYEAITDTIRDLRLRYHFDEATEELTSTDTIGTLGDFKIELESDMAMLLGVVVEDGDTAHPLTLRTKKQFDELYPDINVTDNGGFPSDYCIFGGSIYIGPQPDSTGYVYRLSQSTRGGVVTSSTTAIPFTGVDRELVKHGALSRLFVVMEEPNLAAVHEALFEKRLNINVDRERKNKGEGHFVTRPFTV
jgi:hypothetical protein